MMFNEMIENPALLTDGYKFCHKDQYPAGLEWTYETWTPRKSRIEGVTHAVFFGLQGSLATLYWKWQKGFFERRREKRNRKAQQKAVEQAPVEIAETKPEPEAEDSSATENTEA